MTSAFPPMIIQPIFEIIISEHYKNNLSYLNIQLEVNSSHNSHCIKITSDSGKTTSSKSTSERIQEEIIPRIFVLNKANSNDIIEIIFSKEENLEMEIKFNKKKTK